MSVWVATNPRCIPMTVIEGGAAGVDNMAKKWAISIGQDVIEFPADWKNEGRKAGYIRNREMLDNGRPDCVIAFPGGKGTEMMVKLAMREGVPIHIPRQEELNRYGPDDPTIDWSNIKGL